MTYIPNDAKSESEYQEALKARKEKLNQIIRLQREAVPVTEREGSPRKMKEMAKKYGGNPTGKPVEITGIVSRNIYAET